MGNVSCRRCRRNDADTGPYCGSCAADIMANALNPFHGSRKKKGTRNAQPTPVKRHPQQQHPQQSLFL